MKQARRWVKHQPHVTVFDVRLHLHLLSSPKGGDFYLARTFQLRLAGVESVLPAASVAFTSKVWVPLARLLYVLLVAVPFAEFMYSWLPKTGIVNLMYSSLPHQSGREASKVLQLTSRL